jgi:hypothetical protein
VRIHRKIWLWYGKHWAVQLYINRYISLGIHLDFQRPLLDIHFFWFTFAFGHRPEITPSVDAQRQSCRGFLIHPVL